MFAATCTVSLCRLLGVRVSHFCRLVILHGDAVDALKATELLQFSVKSWHRGEDVGYRL